MKLVLYYQLQRINYTLATKDSSNSTNSSSKEILKNTNDTITINLVQPKINNSTFIEHPFFTVVFFPILVPLIIAYVASRFINKNTEAKLKAETEKIKTSYQPVVLSALQSIQNQIFENKINALKRLNGFKYKYFHYDQRYIDGVPLIDDSYEYYNTIYNNFNNTLFDNFEVFAIDNAILFPSNIQSEFNDLINSIFRVNETRKANDSIWDSNMPPNIETDLKEILNKFETLIDLIREDLHFDNTFIHEFIKTHQK